jgi:hypothetical protein
LQAAQTQEEAQKAGIEYEEKLYELRKRGLDEYKQSVMSAFDALVSGGGGISSFLRSQGMGVLRTMVGNVAAETYKPGRFTLPGQGTPDNPSLLGRLLQGTPFGMDPAAGVQMSAAQIQVQAAQMQLAAASGAANGGSFFPAAARAMGGFWSGPGSGYSGGNPYVMYGSGVDEDAELASIMQVRSGAPTWARYVGYAGAAAGGALGTYSGIKTGGVRGAMAAGGSLTSAAGAIMSMAGVSGPAAPIMMGVGLGLGLGTMLFGDPKRKRAEALESEAAAREYTAGTGTSYAYDTYGRGTDYDMTGRLRPIIIQISAMDTQSFADAVDRGRVAIADGMARAISDGNADAMVGTLRQAML